MGRHPKVSLTQSHIGGHMMDPFRVEVVQLDLVVVKEPHQERVRGHREAVLVEIHKRDHKARRWFWNVFGAREHVVSLTKEPTGNKRI